MKKIILFTALLLASATAAATQTSVWRSQLTRGAGTLVQDVDAATSEAALQACHLLIPNSATTPTEYTCNAAVRVYTVGPDCPATPAPRPGTCPAGMTGTWTQTASIGPPPTCTITWSAAPAGACTSTTQPLPAPTGVTGVTLTANANRVTWNQVSGARAYAFERCIGATCTGFSLLTCTQQLVATHSSLPTGVVVRYRVKASRATTCNAADLGAPSAIVHVTTGAPQPAGGTATLQWIPPTHNTNGTALTDLTGYDIVYGRSEGAMTSTIRVKNAGLSSYIVRNLAAGDWYFAVRAVAADGDLSALSNVVRKTIT